MIVKVDANIPVAPFARPIERAAAGASEAKAEPVPQKAAMAPKATYDFQFRIDRETSEITAVLINPETRAVIREIPAKEMHAASDVIRRLIGPLIDKIV